MTTTKICCNCKYWITTGWSNAGENKQTCAYMSEEISMHRYGNYGMSYSYELDMKSLGLPETKKAESSGGYGTAQVYTAGDFGCSEFNPVLEPIIIA